MPNADCLGKSQKSLLIVADLDRSHWYGALGFIKEKKEKNESDDVDEEFVPYSFYLDDREITKTLEETLNADGERSVEKVTEIIYQPQAQFKFDLYISDILSSENAEVI